ncbi:MAG: ABC transporter ATP-binding protein [Sulfurospirillaceae bacterium]|nr:ABC transporter ATP-binding protein [Sulfurospirillaceae bacterium]
MLEVVNVSCGYSDEIILNNISFSLKRGEAMAILGANGSGKSTLIKAILGQIPYQGAITVQGEDLINLSSSKCMAMIAYVPQNSVLPTDITVFEAVFQGRKFAISLGVEYATNHHDTVWQALTSVGIRHLHHKVFRYLSSGEKQLVLIAKAIAQEAHFIVLDEPLFNLLNFRT